MKSGEKKLLQYFNLEVDVTSKPSREILEHLKDYTLGTPGRLRFRQTRIEEKIRNIGTSYFLVLKRFQRIIGTIGFCLRNTKYKSAHYKSWYIRYFSIRAPLRSKIHKAKGKTRDIRTADNIIKTAVEESFINPNYFFTGKDDEAIKSFIYAYIERDNIRSANFGEMVGFEKARKFKTVFFTRLKPKYKHPVYRLIKEEQNLVSQHLREFYKDHTMFCEQNLFIDNNYYVYKIDDEIVAGLQANPESLEIKEIPGLYGIFAKKVVPKIPLFKKIMNFDDFRFSALEAIYYKKGCEKYLFYLIESVLVLQNNHFGLTWQDTGSPVYSILKKSGSLGIMSKFIRSVEADITVRFVNWSEEEKRIIKENPAYISAYDMT